MKKPPFLALAIAAMFAVTSCGNSTTSTEPATDDTTQVDSVSVDPVAVDTVQLTQ